LHYTYTPRGVCSRKIEFDLNEDGTVTGIRFTGGCSGNTQGVSALAEGKKADDIIKTLSGIRCGVKGTSCPDQLARSIEEALRQNG